MDSDKNQTWQEIELDVGFDEFEPVADYIIENISTGLVFEDEDDSDITRLRFYVSSDVDFKAGLDGLRKFMTGLKADYADLTIRSKEIENVDWIETYRKSVTSIEVGDSIVIKPPWDKEKHSGKTEILLEPKMAFGTGYHETSRSCLAELETINLTGKTMLDFGCGSGILSIFAALKGAANVEGFDIDRLAVENSRENFILNRTENICRSEQGSIDDIPGDKRYDIVVANIIKEVILPILPRLKSLVDPGGILILSGFTKQDQALIESEFEKNGLTDFRIRSDVIWITYTFHLT